MSTSDLDLASLRDLAVGVAYRMVGSRTEAEDLAQEALVRVRAAADREVLRSPEAFTTTVTTRLAVDHLRSARIRREAYVGPWLPEPVLDDPLGDPDRAAELADSLSFAFLVVLERLGPVERAAFLLHDVFSFEYPEIAATLDRSEAACRQIVSRARRRVVDAQPRHTVQEEEHRKILERFMGAAHSGDVDQLVSMLAEDAMLVTDGGPSRKAARYPIMGRSRVARFLRTVGPVALGTFELVDVNGEPGLVARRNGHVYLTGTIELDAAGQVWAIRWVLNPDKLHWIDDEPGATA